MPRKKKGREEGRAGRVRQERKEGGRGRRKEKLHEWLESKTAQTGDVAQLRNSPQRCLLGAHGCVKARIHVESWMIPAPKAIHFCSVSPRSVFILEIYET